MTNDIFPDTFIEEDVLFKYWSYHGEIYQHATPEQAQAFHQMSKFLQTFSAYVQQHPAMKELAFECEIAGGAVRDTIMQKPVKDWDMVFFTHYPFPTSSEEFIDTDYGRQNNAYLKLISDRALELNLCNTEEHKNTSATDLFNRILAYVLKDIYHIEKVYSEGSVAGQPIQDEIDSDTIMYDKPGLNGVIKIKNSENVPIDILVTFQNIESFIDNFDFGLCKALVCHTEQGPYVLQFKDFLHDKEHNTFSYNPLLHSEEAMESSLFEHFPRLAQKYPEFDLSIRLPKDKEVYNNFSQAHIALAEQMLPTAKSYARLSVLPEKKTRQKNHKI